MVHTSRIICAKCKKAKPMDGWKVYKEIKRDRLNRPVYSKQCKDCYLEELNGLQIDKK